MVGGGLLSYPRGGKDGVPRGGKNGAPRGGKDGAPRGGKDGAEDELPFVYARALVDPASSHAATG